MTEYIADGCPNPKCSRIIPVVIDGDNPVRNYCGACGTSFTAMLEGTDNAEEKEE